MRRNPFFKFLTKEDHLQIQIGNWIRYQHPDLLWIHPPNEGRRSKFEQFLMKILGAKPGACDMIFFKANEKYHGLALELKVIYDSGQKNYPSKNQKEFIKKLIEEGWYADVVWTFDEAIKIIKDYLNNKL